MFVALSKGSSGQFPGLLRSMHYERKRIFVDLLKWNVPVVDGELEMDEFDTDDAIYLVICDPSSGAHQASMRLLRTDRPHILGDIFPELCAGPVPRDPAIYEVTRLCMSPRLRKPERLDLRARLACGIVEFAMLMGIRAYTAVADLNWLSQLLAAGWDCDPLGIPQNYGGAHVGALRINITSDTLKKLRANGYDARSTLTLAPALDHSLVN